MNQVEFFKSHKEILENLFSQKWFLETKHKDHPAHVRWTLCNRIIEQDGVILFPEQQGELPIIGRIALDSYILIALTEGNLNQLKLGSLDLYGDEAVQKKIRSRITDPEQFEDLMVELYIGAWHKTKNHDVTPLEKERYPDLEIEIPEINSPVFIECKNLWTGSENRLRKVINKANNQIKFAKKELNTSHYGAVILDVSTPINAGQVENDNPSDELQKTFDVIHSALSGPKNRAVNSAVAVWDDYMVMGEPPDRTLIAFRRRLKHILHGNETLVVEKKPTLFEGYTATYWLSWKPRELPIEGYVFSDMFKKECRDKFHISKKDVIQTIQKSDNRESITLNGQKEMVFYSRFKPSGEHEFHFLVCAEKTTQNLIIYWAFKIFTDLCKEVQLLSPIQLLDRFANTFGLSITIGELTSKFILAHSVNVSSPDPTNFLIIHNPEDHNFMNSFLFKVVQDDDVSFFVNCALVFCIDTTRYVKWITR